MSQFSAVQTDIARHLTELKWQLVTAESCTGGLIASCLTEQAGSSVWFERGFVTYSNLAKQELLDVPEALIMEFGAVSEPVALAMAVGALQRSAGHIALSVTGIAGPGGGSVDKPVGTVCFGWAAHGMTPQTLTKQFVGNRQDIRLAACQQALEGVLAIIKRAV
ncbi:MAG: CinA family protein [Legionellales bacterium]